MVSLSDNKVQNYYDYSLSIYTAKASKHRITAQCLFILVCLLGPITIFNFDLVGLGKEIASDIRSCNLSAIGAVAEMPSGFGEKLGIFNGYGNAATKARSSHAL